MSDLTRLRRLCGDGGDWRPDVTAGEVVALLDEVAMIGLRRTVERDEARAEVERLIVAWLRGELDKSPDDRIGDDCAAIADAIERGDYEASHGT